MKHPHPITVILTSILFFPSCTTGNDGNQKHDTGKQLTDSVYLLGNKQIPGKLFHGADGYDYYVAKIFLDSLLTFDEALKLEKDGWVLPKSLGYFATSSSGGVLGQRMEYKTIHTDSDDPVIERMVGSPRLLVEVLPDLSFQNIVGLGEFWSGTPLGNNNAVYYTVRHQYNGIQMSSITDTGDPKYARKKVVLVKRIPNSNTIFYTNPVNNRKFPARNINNFEIVDPSGGLNLNFHTPLTASYASKYDHPDGIFPITEYEKDGWNLPDYEILSRLFNTIIEAKSTITTTSTPELRRIFPPSNNLPWTSYLGRESEGEYFIYKVEYPQDGEMRVRTEKTNGYQSRVRLFKSAGTPDYEALANEPDDLKTSDMDLLGLSGRVESVSYTRENGEPYLTIKFDNKGKIIPPEKVRISRDNRDRIIKYTRYIGSDSEDNYEYVLSYRDNSNRPSNYSYGSWGSTSSNKISYTDDGIVSKLETEANYEGEEDTDEIIDIYTILEKDNHGNWTRRRVEEKRIVSYMIENAMGEYSPRQHVDNETYIETRIIKYHTK